MARLNFSNPNLIQVMPKVGGALTPVYTALTGFTGIQFSNTGRETVWIVNGATASNYTINYGPGPNAAVITAIGPTACPVSNVNAVCLAGPFPSYFNQNDGNNSVYIDFSTVTTVTIAIIQMVGVS